MSEWGGFYLGSHVVTHIEKTSVPLFISFRRIQGRKKALKQMAPVCIDSGGFSELKMYGRWTVTPEEYVEELHRLQKNGLKIRWAAQQDWMVEPFMVEKTGLSIEEHQRRTVQNFLHLRSLKPNVHIIPVLQGWTLQDYYNCFDMFEAAGVDLRLEKVVGVGSVCRRQGTKEIEHIMKSLHAKGIKIHGFGVKTSGLSKYGPFLYSADSLAWSFGARYNRERCATHQHEYTAINCANCLLYALEWRDKVLSGVRMNEANKCVDVNEPSS